MQLQTALATIQGNNDQILDLQNQLNLKQHQEAEEVSRLKQQL